MSKLKRIAKQFLLLLSCLSSTLLLLLLFLFVFLSFLENKSVFAHHRIPDFEYRASKIWKVEATLLDALCRWETRKWAYKKPKNKIERDYYEYRRDNSHSKFDAIGRCQVRVITAAYLLGLDSNNIPLETFKFIDRALRDSYINTYFAAWVLSRCLRLNKWYKNKLERAIFCYNEGPRKRWKGATNFTKNVLHKYGNMKLEHFVKKNRKGEKK